MSARRCGRWMMAFFLWGLASLSHAFVPTDLTPGTFRMANEAGLEAVLHQLQPGWSVEDSGLGKSFSPGGSEKRPWETNWGQYLKTDFSARFSPSVTGRAFFEAQGNYADRYWRPLNINHYEDRQDNHVFLRQAEARLDRPHWFVHGFSGVGHGDWKGRGDFFGLYPESFPDNSYMGSSGYFGVYPSRWQQDTFLNISHRNVPRGLEAGANLLGTDASLAYGKELAWGYGTSGYGRWRVPIGFTKLTFVYKDEGIPFQVYDDFSKRRQAGALAWAVPFEAGHRLEIGVLYQPYLAGKNYTVDRKVSAGSGLLGSSHSLSQKTALKEDGLGGRVRMELRPVLFDKLWTTSVDLTHLGILAGNRQQADASLGATLSPEVSFDLQYTYRRPVEGPIPLLYEGTPQNMGAIAANPRGPESPFVVDGSNREAVFLTATVWIDPTPGSRMFLYDPHEIEGWNVNPEETSPLTAVLQGRMRDYRTATDRQNYYDENGDVVWEPAGHTGAWPTAKPLYECRVMGFGKLDVGRWVLGLAGGQAPAASGLAYSHDPSRSKPITEYYSLEGRLERWPVALWGHYGTGLWGPEMNIHPFWGYVFDRLWGIGVSYSITVNTTWDVSYLAAREDDGMFVAPDLGSYEEIRTMLSHRFGFDFKFQEE
ncbi:MAG: hypothetical protein LHV69_03280 [Elusimicrobia bacterium]|nr:hypothetical protein [Candidatus Obscuribacterium magneticum]